MAGPLSDYIVERSAAWITNLAPHTKALVIPLNVEHVLRAPQRFHLYRAEFSNLHVGVVAATSDLTTVLLLHGVRLTAGKLRSFPGAERQLEAAGLPVPQRPDDSDGLPVVLVESMRDRRSKIRVLDAGCSYRTTATLSADLIRAAVPDEMLQQCVSCLHFANAFLASVQDTCAMDLSPPTPIAELLVEQLVPDMTFACVATQALRVLGDQETWLVSPFRLAEYENCFLGAEFPSITDSQLTTDREFSAAIRRLPMYQLCVPLSSLCERQRFKHAATSLALSSAWTVCQLISMRATAVLLRDTHREATTHAKTVGAVALQCEQAIPKLVAVVSQAQTLQREVDERPSPNSPKEFYQLWRKFDGVARDLRAAQENTTCLLTQLDSVELRVSKTKTTVMDVRAKCVMAVAGYGAHTLACVTQALLSGLSRGTAVVTFVGLVRAVLHVADIAAAQRVLDQLAGCLMSIHAYKQLLGDVKDDLRAADRFILDLREKTRKRPSPHVP